MQDIWLMGSPTSTAGAFPERVVHAKGSGRLRHRHRDPRHQRLQQGRPVQHRRQADDQCSCASPPWPGEGAATTPNDVRGFALKFYTEQGGWDLVNSNSCRCSSFRDP